MATNEIAVLHPLRLLQQPSVETPRPLHRGVQQRQTAGKSLASALCQKVPEQPDGAGGDVGAVGSQLVHRNCV
jgi:hypothetical protein